MNAELRGTPVGVLVAIDVGTSGARATAFDLEGHQVLEARRGYPTSSERPGWAQQDPRQWRSASLSALADLVRGLPSAEVLAVSLTGQCPSVVLLDEHHQPLTAGLMYRDNRAAGEAAELRERFGARELHRRTGHLAAGFHIAPKLLWLRRREPAALGRAALLLQPRDLVALELTGEAATDGTHAAATLLYDLQAGDWDLQLVGALDLDPRMLPPVIPSAAVLGGLRPGVARRVGLRPGLPVVIGAADSQACALGAGVVAQGPVSEMAGSSTCLNAAVRTPLDVLEVTHYPHVVPGWYTTETGINTTGAAVTWLADLLYAGRSGRARSGDYARLDAEAAAVPPGADGVLALPVLADGERTDAELRAAMTGLSLRHGRAVLARAMLEGVALAMRGQLMLLSGAGVETSELRVSGGDSRLATWNRIKADVIGRPVRTVPGDAAAAGVAMLGGLGAGVYRDVEDALARCVRLEPAVEPDPASVAIYDEIFPRHLELARSVVVRRAGGSED